MTEAEHGSESELTKNTPYLNLMGEIWDIYCEYFGENRPRHNGTLLCIPSKPQTQQTQ